MLSGSAFVINLSSRPDRLDASTLEIKHAGFTDIHRFPAVDACDSRALEQAWATCGSPSFADWDGGFKNVPGKQGCFLSHLTLWQQIVAQDLPYASVFEDDVVFHGHWSQLAPTAFDFTPQDYDLLFMGNMNVTPGPGLVRRTPVYCTHAYVITREGAQRLRSLLLDDPEGVGSIDIMLFRRQQQAEENSVQCLFTWYVWNGTTFPCPRAADGVGWSSKNTGFVFQDFALGSDVS
jgi:GR25 family glycosyltransferase involved in LPS biosynthesis